MSVQPVILLNPMRDWWLSAVLHTTVVAIAVFVTMDRTQKSSVNFEVIDAPSVAMSPLRIEKAPEPQKKTQVAKPRAVFGLSQNTLQSSETSPNAVSIKAGNTIAKAPDQETLNPSDAQSLPIPSDEYLVTQMPEILNEFRVPYPKEAKEKGIQGAVVFDLLIDDQGIVRKADLIEGPGSGLNEAAAQAVMQFRFKPARVEAKSVAVKIRYAYRFVLER